MSRWLKVSACMSLVVGSAFAVAAPSQASTSVYYKLNLRFNEGTDGNVVSSYVNAGGAALRISTVTNNGGRARWDASPNGLGVRLPAFASVNEPHAVIQVTDPSGADGLSPGSRGFGVGADFRLNSISAKAGSGDDGNNLVQRGLHYQSAQYKLQVDNHTPSCTVKGSGGSTTVAGPRVSAEKWYRLRCVRSGSQLTLSVAALASNGSPGTPSQTGRASAAGTVTFSRSVPLSVGGKLAAVNQLIHTESIDQFNGVVDNIVFWLI